MDWNCGYS